jgi:hypothetical protein
MSKKKQGVPSVQEQITSFSWDNFEKMRSNVPQNCPMGSMMGVMQEQFALDQMQLIQDNMATRREDMARKKLESEMNRRKMEQQFRAGTPAYGQNLPNARANRVIVGNLLFVFSFYGKTRVNDTFFLYYM